MGAAVIRDRKQAVIDAGIFPAVIRDLFPSMQTTGKDQALVCCPFHQDETPSLSVNLPAGLFHCFACGAKGNGFDLFMKVRGCDFKTALNDLEERAGINAAPKVKPRKVATFSYTNETGKRLYIKERWEPARNGKRSKEFSFSYFDKQGNRQTGFKGQHVLYRLHEIVKADQVFILEGEKKADLLSSWGLAATCLDTGAASKWRDSYTPHLAGKDIIVVPDNDEAGEGYLQTVARALYGVARSLHVLRLPGLPEKGDVLDYCKAQGGDPMTTNNATTGLKVAFAGLVSAAVPWEPGPPSEEVVKERLRRRDRASSSSPDEVRARGAELVFPILADCPLHVDVNTGAAVICINEKLQPLDTRNRELAEEILFLCGKPSGAGCPSKEAVNTAISYFAAKARREGSPLELFNRLGERGGLIYYYMGNGWAVEIGPGSWRIVPAPVMFRNTSTQRPQPEPDIDGNPWQIFEFLPVAPEYRLLLMVYIVLAFVPRIFKPALQFIGPQGSGKSLICSFIKMVIDPTGIMLSSMPRKPEDLDLILWRYYVTVLDNLSGLSGEVCDRLCTFITGGAVEKRTLHTDLETTILKTNSLVILNGIVALHDSRPDLSERTWRIPLERLSKERRTTEKLLWRAFEAALPEILGGCFSTLAKAMEIHPKIEGTLTGLPRMADAAEWGFCIAEALEEGRGAEFLRDCTGNAILHTADLLETNTFFCSIVQAMERPGPGGLSGTFKEVLSILTEIAAPGGSGAKALEKDRSFPSSPRSFRKHLERLKVPLEDMGITYMIDNHRTNKGRAAVEFRLCDPEPGEAGRVEENVFDDKDDLPF